MAQCCKSNVTSRERYIKSLAINPAFVFVQSYNAEKVSGVNYFCCEVVDGYGVRISYIQDGVKGAL